MNKVVYVKAPFKALGRTRSAQVPTGETKKNFLGITREVTRKEKRFEQTGWSDCEIDGAALAADVATAIAELNDSGYEVVTVFPVISGRYAYKMQEGHISSSPRLFSETEAVSGKSGYSYGYGYSFTEGVTIVARKFLGT